jgi:hypothetical protein
MYVNVLSMVYMERKNTITLNILFSSSISDFPGQSGFMVRNSAKIQPTLHKSIGVEYSYKNSSQIQ